MGGSLLVLFLFVCLLLKRVRASPTRAQLKPLSPPSCPFAGPSLACFVVVWF